MTTAAHTSSPLQSCTWRRPLAVQAPSRAPAPAPAGVPCPGTSPRQSGRWLIAGVCALACALVPAVAFSAPAVHATSETSRWGFSAAYFGETFTHPGVRLGAERTLVERGGYQLLATADVTHYVHRRNHIALGAGLGLGNRYTGMSGWYVDGILSVAYLHAWPQGDVYARGDDGQVAQVFDPGRPYVAPEFSVGFGLDLARRAVAPLRVFVRLGAFGQYPFNGYMLPHLTGQVGVIWRPNLSPR